MNHVTWRLLVIGLLTLAMTACGSQSNPQPDALAAHLQASLTRPPVAAYLIDPQLRDVEEIDARGISVTILFRRDAAEPDRQVLKLHLKGDLSVVLLPPANEAQLKRAVPNQSDPEAMRKFRAVLQQSRLEAAARIPRKQRTQTMTIDRQVQVGVRRVADAWELVLPSDLASSEAGP